MEIPEIIQNLEEKGYKIGRASQMKTYKEKHPLYLIDVKKSGNYANIFNGKQICYFRVKVIPYRQRKKANICCNCSGYYRSAKNCHMRPRCIKCNGQNSTRECSIKEKITDRACIICGETGHLAAWKGCKALPTIKKPSARQAGKTYAQAATDKRKKKKTEEKSTEKNTDVADDLKELKESFQALKEMKTLLLEFPTLLEAARLCRKARTRQEKVLIVLNALMND
ncbi:hypothetical protein AVEN_58535-1 [Araneus ventricosus]|uniref:Pre-C2HC domain-containing protein n=1 Tax=Araneus ventricosus TaxID=182803 RepID=A0A4Y2NMQ0_ARAVE|nr:hypothetical protein AVEN_58535-1 [Araneus ventricosus]